MVFENVKLGEIYTFTEEENEEMMRRHDEILQGSMPTYVGLARWRVESLKSDKRINRRNL